MDYANGREFLKYFENVRTRTTRVIERIPAEQIDWRPTPDAFSFADLIRHIAATERYMFGENVQGNQSRYPGHGPELADGYDQTMKYFQRCHAEAVEIFAALTEDQLQRKVGTPGGIEMTCWKWLRGMIEHEVHHRGQIYLMLKTIGVTTPPLYGLTSEEVKARSLTS
jgi:uncharacterized damage-inducible protein DinB